MGVRREVVSLAVDTASTRSWRPPLLAWLRLQHQPATQAGNADEVARLTRRIELLLLGLGTPQRGETGPAAA